jgi:hypothetical protein
VVIVASSNFFIVWHDEKESTKAVAPKLNIVWRKKDSIAFGFTGDTSTLINLKNISHGGTE